MMKKNKVVCIAFVAILCAWGILFGTFRSSYQVLYPGNNFEIYAVTDSAAGGFSTSALTVKDSSISASVNIRSGKAYPYAGMGFNLMSQKGRLQGYFDFSKFDSLAVEVSTGRMRKVTLRILTDDPVYSKTGHYLSYRPLEQELEVPGNFTEVKCPLSGFKNKEWWLVAQGLDKDDQLSYFYRATLFEIFNGEGALRGIPDEIEVRKIRMWGENVNFEKGMLLFLGLLILLFVGWLWLASRNPKDREADKACLDQVVKLLKTTDKSIAEIALAVGMSQGRLEREFKKVYKVAPLDYRRHHE